MPQQEEGEDRLFAEGVRETGKRQRRPESSDRGAEAAEAAAGLHAQPAPADLHRPSPERPDARGREEPFHPAHQGEHLTTPQPHRLVLVRLHGSAARWRTSDPRSHSVSQSPMSDRGCFCHFSQDLQFSHRLPSM